MAEGKERTCGQAVSSSLHQSHSAFSIYLKQTPFEFVMACTRLRQYSIDKNLQIEKVHIFILLKIYWTMIQQKIQTNCKYKCAYHYHDYFL